MEKVRVKEKGEIVEMEICGENKCRSITIEKCIEVDGITYVHLKMIQDEVKVPETFTLKWKFPSRDCYSVWSPQYDSNRELGGTWLKKRINARLAVWMPLHCIVSLNGKNRLTIAVSDAVTPISIASGVCEEDACIDCEVEFFISPVAALKEYSAIVRIDMRDMLYSDSVYDAVWWWENSCGYFPAEVPEHAKLPMNSLWYSYHQNLDVEDIIRECKLSKEMGMETVIIDDGWQTYDNNRGYDFCGDWEVEKTKVPDMAEFVERIHNTGMKVMLWYSVPYLGIKSKNYKYFKDMLLDNGSENSTYWSLDPRYKEVRDFLVGTYKNALLEWNIDGLKLDFIDAFVLQGKSLEFDERRDYQCLEDAVDVLMKEIAKVLKEIKPDVLIEFRQKYIGPAIRQYGNMLRVGDCPNDALVNRVNIVNLRLTSGKTAVHSDMLMWNYNDFVENAAMQIASSLYAVPQISMKLQQMNDLHKKMLKYYLSFWVENRDILINGKLFAENPESDYSIVCANKDKVSIYTVYTKCIIEGNGEKRVIAVNASGNREILLKNFNGRKYKIVDCMGNEIETGSCENEICLVEIPLCGIVFVE